MRFIEAGASTRMNTHFLDQAPQALWASAVLCAQGSFPGEGLSAPASPAVESGLRSRWGASLAACFHWKLFYGSDSLFSGLCLWRVRCKPSEMFYKVWTWDGQWTPEPKPRVLSVVCVRMPRGSRTADASEVFPDELCTPTKLDIT